MYEPEPKLNHEQNYENPNWEATKRTYDWRNYVGDRTRELWNVLLPYQRRAIALDAQDRADMEDCD